MSHKEKSSPSVIDDQTGGATDQVGIGPTSAAGLEASEMPDHGRGPAETNMGKEAARKLPGQTGGVVGNGTDSGLAAEPGLANARDHGHRGKN